jgi:flagellar biosynthesis protein FlhF
MKLRTFYADTPREALRLVRAHLGEGALIVSNRKVGARIEIMAASAAEFQVVTGAVAPPRPARPDAARAPRSRTAGGPLPGAARRGPGGDITYGADGRALAQPGAIPAPAAGVGRTPLGDLLARPATPAPRAAGSIAPAHPAATPDTEADRFDLVHEVRMLRSLVEGQLAAIAWGELGREDRTKLEVARRLLRAGFGMKLAQHYARALPPGLELNAGLRLAKAQLQRELPVGNASDGLVERGGVYALVGPTGVGKTTTVAKIAAECALRFGHEHVALVTTDTYRIGAVDQLRIYGRILNAPVFAIRDEADLRQTLANLRARRLVLIDTIGMSQRDQRLAEQVALLAGAGRAVRRVLLLPAVAQPSVLDDVVQAYRGAALAGCILTKVDEAPSLGGALDALLRHRLTLHYVANGQRVPEDLHRPSALYLVERAFRLASGAAAPAADAPPATDAELLFAAAQG